MNKRGRNVQQTKVAQTSYVQVKNKINIVSMGNKYYFEIETNDNIKLAKSKEYNSLIDVNKAVDKFITDFSLSKNNVSINNITKKEIKTTSNVNTNDNSITKQSSQTTKKAEVTNAASKAQKTTTKRKSN